ncbi:MAG: hypothetical protein Tsb005_14320 [Gammaproteobacteria bacterium]
MPLSTTPIRGINKYVLPTSKNKFSPANTVDVNNRTATSTKVDNDFYIIDFALN